MTTNYLTLTNASRSNLEAFFDGLSSTTGAAPTLQFDTYGLTFSDGVLDDVRLQMSLYSARLGLDRALTLSIDGVSLRSDVTAGGAALTLQPGLLTGSIVFDGRPLASFTLNNVDADVLAVTQAGDNGMPGLSLKLDSLMSRILNGTDDALQIGSLSATDAAALVSVVFRAAIADKTPEQLLAWAQSLVTLPATLDTVGELAHFVQQVFTQPLLSSLTFGDLQAYALSGALGDGSQTPLLLSALAALADLKPTMNLSEALTAVQAKPALADLSLNLLAGGLTQQAIDTLVAATGIDPSLAQAWLSALAASGQPLTPEGVFDDLVGGALHLLEASGLSVGDVLLQLVSSSDNLAALDSALAAIDLTPLGLDKGWVTDILHQIHASGSVDLASLLPIAVKTFLAYEGSATFVISDAAGLGISSDGHLIDSASVIIPLGDAPVQTAALVYDFAGVNDAPEALPAVASVAEGETASGQVHAIDPDVGDKLSFALADPDNAPLGLTFNADGSWSFDASTYEQPQGSQRVMPVLFTATDAGGLSSSSTLTITVNGVNDAPVGEVSIAGEAVVGATLKASKTLTDADGMGTITYSWYAGQTLLGQGDSYQLTKADAGQSIRVVASYFDGGTDEAVSSSGTQLVVDPQPQQFATSGMVYQWKTHALLSDVALSLGGVDPAAVNPAYELRDIAVDAKGQVTVELWVDAGAGVSNLDLQLGFAADAASFTLDPQALQGWAVTRSDGVSNVGIAAMSLASQVSGQFKLGTLSLGNAGAIDTSFTVAGHVGEQQVGYQAMMGSTTTGADGHFVFDGIQSGQYALLAYKPLGPSEAGSAINSADALAALKLAVGRELYTDPDGSGPLKALAVSPYQFIAADVNEDGRVTSADALEILKMAVFRSDAIPREWLFVSESADFWDENAGVFTIDRNHVSWEHDSIQLEVAGADLAQNLVAVLKGDVNGSWSAPAGSEIVADNHFNELVLNGVGPLDQWGIVNPGLIG